METATKSGAPSVDRLLHLLGSESYSEHFYVTLLGLGTFDAVKLHDKVGRGLPYKALERLRSVAVVRKQLVTTLHGGRPLCRPRDV